MEWFPLCLPHPVSILSPRFRDAQPCASKLSRSTSSPNCPTASGCGRGTYAERGLGLPWDSLSLTPATPSVWTNTRHAHVYVSAEIKELEITEAQVYPSLPLLPSYLYPFYPSLPPHLFSLLWFFRIPLFHRFVNISLLLYLFLLFCTRCSASWQWEPAVRLQSNAPLLDL